MRRALRQMHLGMRHHAIAAAGKRLAMHWDHRHAGPLLQPGMRHGDDRLQAEAFDHDGRLVRRQRGIHEQRDAPFLAQRFVEPNDRAFALDHGVPGLLAQFIEEFVEQRVLELLRRDRTRVTDPRRSRARATRSCRSETCRRCSYSMARFQRRVRSRPSNSM